MHKTIAITGASGHLGTAIINILLQDTSYDIKALYYSFLPPITAPNLSWTKGNLTKESLLSFTKNVDIVIHCAALISIEGDPNGKVHETNVVGVENVIDACITNSVKRLLHISSTHALQEYPHDQPFDESRPYKTASNLAYDFSKAQGEQLILDAIKNRGLDAVILRPASLIGPPDYKLSLLGKAIGQFSRGELPAVVPGGYSFVDVRDVAQTVVNAIEKGITGESYNLTGTFEQIGTVAKMAAKIGHSRAPLLSIPHWVVIPFIPLIKLLSTLTGSALPFTRDSLTILKDAHPNMTYSKAQKQLGHTPRPLIETLTDLITWLHEQDTKK